ITSEGITQITKDHSVVQAMVETGELTQEEAKIHPSKNLITRALGVDEEIRVDFCEYDMGKRDVLLICTDGLTNFVDPDDIKKITSEKKYYEFADNLVNLANDAGGGDNITVVVIAY
ncbi:MAG: serine/threonine-protein phosphatase, partial [Oscillospiraceae bacterium]|nr:serine/threonine-protein phosphatase [Oscillospiraceae bacterium]